MGDLSQEVNRNFRKRKKKDENPFSFQQIRAGIQMDWKMRKEIKMTIKDIAEKYDVSIGMVKKWKDLDSHWKKRGKEGPSSSSPSKEQYIL